MGFETEHLTVVDILRSGAVVMDQRDAQQLGLGCCADSLVDCGESLVPEGGDDDN